MHALQSKRTRIRQPVAVPDYLFLFAELKRALIECMLDRILRRAI